MLNTCIITNLAFINLAYYLALVNKHIEEPRNPARLPNQPPSLDSS